MEISQTADIDFIKTKAFTIRHSVIEDLENKLVSLESKLTEKKFQVFWASNEKELTDMVFDILPSSYNNRFCFDLPKTPDAFSNTKVIKKIPLVEVENGQQNASYLFTQADFAVVETGTLVLLDKKCKNCFNKVENIFILLDINKLINKMADLETILYLKTFYQEEHYLPTDVKLIERPIHKIITNRLQREDQKHYEVIDVNVTVFLYDNGITKIMENQLLRNSLYCIDCGKCKSVCPIFSYTKEYSPIDLVKAHCFVKPQNSKELFKNTLLCGNCDQVCPVQIPFTDLIIREMEMANPHENGISKVAKVFAKRKKLNKMNGHIRRHFFLKKLFGKNKMLFSYFKEQKDTFFNIDWQQNHSSNEQ